MISPTLGFIMFPIVYVLFKLGYSPVALSWASLFMYAVLGIIVKPILIIKIAGYHWKDIFKIFRSCILVTIVSLPIPIYSAEYDKLSSFSHSISVLIITLLISIYSIYTLGLDKYTKKKIFLCVKKRIISKTNHIR